MAVENVTKEQHLQMIRDVAGPIVAEAVEQAMARALEGVKAPSGNGNGLLARMLGDIDPTTLLAMTGEREKKNLERFGRVVRAIGAAHLNLRRAGGGPITPYEVLDKWGDKELAATVQKAMSASTGTEGGHLIPTQLSADVIEFLRPASVVRRLNPNTVPMPNGSIRIPKVTGGSSAFYQGENVNATASQLTVGQVVLTFKKLTALVPASNDLLRYSGPGATAADALIRDDVVRAIAQRENQGFLRDNGTESTPKGIRNWAPAANVVNSAGTALANMITDLSALLLLFMNANIPEGRWAWIMSPRSYLSLYTVQNANGFFVFRDEMTRGNLWGLPYAYTTQMPGSGATGELYLVNMADALVGEAQTLIIDVSMEASYIDAATSTLVSAFSLDQSVIRAIAEHDFGMRRPESVGVLQAMSW